MMYCCARCGIEFDRGNTNSQYCDDCKMMHRLEANQARWRDKYSSKAKRKAKRPKCRTTIQDVLELAPKYGLQPYEYGVTVSKMEELKTERCDAK